MRLIPFRLLHRPEGRPGVSVGRGRVGPPEADDLTDSCLVGRASHFQLLQSSFSLACFDFFPPSSSAQPSPGLAVYSNLPGTGVVVQLEKWRAWLINYCSTVGLRTQQNGTAGAGGGTGVGCVCGAFLPLPQLALHVITATLTALAGWLGSLASLAQPHWTYDLAQVVGGGLFSSLRPWIPDLSFFLSFSCHFGLTTTSVCFCVCVYACVRACVCLTRHLPETCLSPTKVVERGALLPPPM